MMLYYGYAFTLPLRYFTLDDAITLPWPLRFLCAAAIAFRRCRLRHYAIDAAAIAAMPPIFSAALFSPCDAAAVR